MPLLRRASALLVACLAPLLAAPTSASESAAWAALRSGGHVALMRHADAPGGAGDPLGFDLADCSTQRNLSPKGRAEAVAAGKAFKDRGVSVAAILSSPWCRCLETATLMDLGPVKIEDAFSNAFVLRDRREALRERAAALLRGWTEGTLLVVTHGANVQALTGHHPASGEIVVVAPGGRALRVVGRIPVADQR
jgi:phosphohistidine phosphatase SixA